MDRELVTIQKRKREWVMPGEEIVSLKPGAVVSIGRGLKQDLTKLISVRSGQYDEQNNKHVVIGDEKSYIPRNEDIIVGTIVRGGGFIGYWVDAGAGSLFKLDSLAFDGASKRLRPELKVGASVYARVIQSRSELEMVVSCHSVTGVKKDWVTGESLFGELKGGYIHSIRTQFAKMLLADYEDILSNIGDRLAFECCIGVNGRIWLRAKTIKQTARLARCLTEIQRVVLPQGNPPLQTVKEVLDDFFPAPKDVKEDDEDELIEL
eukprot:TRINITY_DN7933_c0_g1_i1.p1 TRINITY_DN7933_c0_g1~~TRINITY_DN7933_c0_g1_i1.p1  ORF type:complete len:264 (+),score=42.85 TRINITY_DN7933_c0_g1_i1:39-830(+)